VYLAGMVQAHCHHHLVSGDEGPLELAVAAAQGTGALLAQQMCQPWAGVQKQSRTGPGGQDGHWQETHRCWRLLRRSPVPGLE